MKTDYLITIEYSLVLKLTLLKLIVYACKITGCVIEMISKQCFITYKSFVRYSVSE